MGLEFGKRLISVILSAALLAQGFSCLAADVTAVPENGGTLPVQSTDVSKVLTTHKIVGEMTDQRSSNVKNFKLDDGTFLAVQYPSAVHYQQNGKWVDIDNTLVDNTATLQSETIDQANMQDSLSGNSDSNMPDSSAANASESAESGLANDVSGSADNDSAETSSNITENNLAGTDAVQSGYENKNNAFKVKFAKNTANSMVRVKFGDYQLSWGIDPGDTKASRKTPVRLLTAPDAQKANSLSESAIQKNNNSFTNLKNISSGCQFSDVYPGVDVNYSVVSEKLKENIVLKSGDSQTQFSFTYKLGRLDMRSAKDGSIEIFDPASPSQAAFQIPKAVMFDAAGASSDDVALTFVKGKGGRYTVTVSANPEWVHSSERTFPVTVDPTVQTPLVEAQIHETFVASNCPDQNYTGR